ncbi:YbtB protein [Listeria aquatica FSL S10-1188]|uniref:YbtB protein n=1 Tax=Listeria aquatica FSL S10-1188 TaxID=1265818 RepID=W7B0U2_9LIST|nr:YbtB protein [Listeria aquatica FSL S10-1188]
MAVTSSGVFGSLALIIAFLSQFWEAIPEEWLVSGFEQAIRLGILLFVVIAILLLIVLWIFSIILTLFKFFQFKLHQFEDHLVVEKGLFERDTTTIKYERIQGVVIVESPLRQILRLVSVKIITAGGADEQNQSGNILLIPIMKKQLALETIKEMLPAYHFEEAKIEKLPKQNLARFLMIYLVWSIIPFLILSVLFYPYGLIAVLLPLFAGLKAIASFRATGFSLSEGTLLLRARPFLSKTTHLVRKERIQSMKVSRSIWMERTKTNHLSIALKSGNSETTPFLRYLSGEQAERLYKWYHPNA